MEELIKIKIELNKLDSSIYLDPREVRILEQSGEKFSSDSEEFIKRSIEFYNSAVGSGDSVTLAKDHLLALEYSKQLEELKDQLELKNKELQKQKEQLEDDLAAETDAKIKMKRTSFQSIFTAALITIVFILTLFPALSEFCGVKLSTSIIGYTEKGLLQLIPILAMAAMDLFRTKNFSTESGKVSIERFDA